MKKIFGILFLFFITHQLHAQEVNKKALNTRHSQGWVDEVFYDISSLVERVKKAQKNREIKSLAYLGNVIDVWEAFYDSNIHVDLGSDQTSLHNPWAGGYYPVGLSYEEANTLIHLYYF